MPEGGRSEGLEAGAQASALAELALCENLAQTSGWAARWSAQVSGADAQIVFAGDRAAVSGDGVKATLKAVEGQPHVSGVSRLQVSPEGKVA